MLSLPSRVYARLQRFHARTIMWILCGVMSLVLLVLCAVSLADAARELIKCTTKRDCQFSCAPFQIANNVYVSVGAGVSDFLCCAPADVNLIDFFGRWWS